MDKLQQAIAKADKAATRAKQLADKARRMGERERKRAELEQAVATYRTEKQRGRYMALIEKQFNRIKYLHQIDNYSGEPTAGRIQIRRETIKKIRAHAPLVAEAQANLMAEGIVPGLTIVYAPWMLADPTDGRI